MTADWKEVDRKFFEDSQKRAEEATPEPLFETTCPEPKLCLVCAEKLAITVLWGGGRSVIPLCKNCSSKWNWYGYGALKSIKPLGLISKIVKYKIRNPLRKPSLFSIANDIKELLKWSKKMSRFMGGKK